MAGHYDPGNLTTFLLLRAKQVLDDVGPFLPLLALLAFLKKIERRGYTKGKTVISGERG
jgi:hypothetical protein